MFIVVLLSPVDHLTLPLGVDFSFLNNFRAFWGQHSCSRSSHSVSSCFSDRKIRRCSLRLSLSRHPFWRVHHCSFTIRQAYFSSSIFWHSSTNQLFRPLTSYPSELPTALLMTVQHSPVVVERSLTKLSPPLVVQFKVFELMPLICRVVPVVPS